MSRIWVTIGALVLLTLLIRASGPLIMGTRKLSEKADAVIGLLAPALLAGLVLTEAFAIGKSLVVDARAVGLGCAALAMALRAPLLVVVLIAAAATAATRAVLA
jgi:branched chain amino acid efflux pump